MANLLRDLSQHPGWKILERHQRETVEELVASCLADGDGWEHNRGYIKGVESVLNAPQQMIELLLEEPIQTPARPRRRRLPI